MNDAAPGLIDDWERARAALSPLRRRLLEALREPGSAAMLAERLKLKRQMLGYHLNALEEAGLVRLHSVRKRRGFEERLLVVAAERFVLDPALLSAGHALVDKQDRFAADHLVALAAETVREVTRMQGAAGAEGKRLITFAIEADVRFAAPEDIERFTAKLAESVAGLIGEFAPAEGGRAYRLTIGGHPAVAGKAKAKIN